MERDFSLVDYSDEDLRREIKAREKRNSIEIPDLLPENEQNVKEIIEVTKWLMNNVKEGTFDSDNAFNLAETCILALYGRKGEKWFVKYHDE